MSEPRATAEATEEVVPGIWRWHVWDDRIDSETSAHAVAAEGGDTVLIDPLPLAEQAFAKLAPVVAICLTAACHQRSAWRYRRAFGAKVYAPAGCRAMDEEPDLSYREGDRLPGGLRAILTPGPEPIHFAFLREQAPAVLFCADLFMREAEGDLSFVPAEYHDDPEATRASVRKLAQLPFEVLCMAHGAPLTRDPHRALCKLLGEGGRRDR